MTNADTAWTGSAGTLFRSLGHEYRLEIMELMRTGPLSGDQLAARMKTTKPLLRPHLKRLERDNLIAKQEAERGHIYSLTERRRVGAEQEIT